MAQDEKTRGGTSAQNSGKFFLLLRSLTAAAGLTLSRKNAEPLILRPNGNSLVKSIVAQLEAGGLKFN